ncbi:hypothetical protein [Paenibacillus illinoisensis]|uniref:hypothetical protein n=1 Tax=Paenibacillus illinoisensis TaxID=59845 RepID=UPI00203B6582|nr:hypothetical protein [Paenibacillus illinoisensis]MCM3208484.1 hypothetical protein [Paenibacillus illinoisensis]
MKKLVYIASGMLLGVILALPLGSAFADQIKSVVGMKITGQYTVKVNGKQLADPAIVAEGKSYAPVRSLVGAVGTGEIIVDNTEKTIDITVESDVPQTSAQETPVQSDTNPYVGLSKEKLLSTKEMFEVMQIGRLEKKIAEDTALIANPLSWTDVNALKENIAKYEVQLAEYTEKLKLVNEAIAALEK